MFHPDLALTTGDLALAVLAAFAAGTIDAIAGGGGLITVPALLATGLPPQIVLGTNKGQSVFGSASALFSFVRAGLVDKRRALITFPLGLFGAFAGAQLMLLVPTAVLRPLVICLLLGAAGFVTFARPGVGPGAVPPRFRALAAGVIALAIGFYDGFFGPGTGTFLIVAFAAILADELNRASANAKVVNFASNLASVILFASLGNIVWEIALPMAAAQIAGGNVGARMVVKQGKETVRKAVLLVVVCMVAKLAYDLVNRG